MDDRLRAARKILIEREGTYNKARIVEAELYERLGEEWYTLPEMFWLKGATVVVNSRTWKVVGVGERIVKLQLFKKDSTRGEVMTKMIRSFPLEKVQEAAHKKQAKAKIKVLKNFVGLGCNHGSINEQPSVEPEPEPQSSRAQAKFIYKSVGTGTIRRGAEKDTEKCGKLAVGEEVLAFERVNMADGTIRLRCEKGWVSVATAKGKPLLELGSGSEE